MNSNYLAKNTGDKVIRYVERNAGGRVIAIDGPWGSGKTYLCEKLREDFNRCGYKSVILDAFANDYHTDALAVLAGVLVNMENNENQRESLIKSLSKNMVPILRLGGMALVKGMSKGLTGVSISGDKVVDEISEELIKGAEAAIYTEIKNYGKLEASINGIKEVVSSISSNSDKGLVIFVDDLDRCRPSFAIELIEKIKHIFECKNVTFILSMNQDQIYNSIAHVYGMNDDLARLYLNKFIARRFALDINSGVAGSTDILSSSKAYIYGLELISSLGFSDEMIEETIDSTVYKMLAALLAYHQIALRDINSIIDNMIEIIDTIGVKLELAVLLVAFQVSLVNFKYPGKIILEEGLTIKDISLLSLSKASDCTLKKIPLLDYMIKNNCQEVYAIYCSHLLHIRNEDVENNVRESGEFFNYIEDKLEATTTYHRMEEVAKTAIEIAV